MHPEYEGASAAAAQPAAAPRAVQARAASYDDYGAAFVGVPQRTAADYRNGYNPATGQRECLDCEVCINGTENWKNRCVPCYFEHRNNKREKERKCRDCGTSVAHRAKHITRCYECYYEHRNSYW